MTGIVEGTDLETTARSAGCGQATRQRQRTDTRGQGRAIAVTGYGWKLRVMIEGRTTRPLAATVGQIQAHEASVTRALVRQAPAHLPAMPVCAGSSVLGDVWMERTGGGWPRRIGAVWSRRQNTGG